MLEMQQKIIGVQATMTKFRYLVGVILGKCIPSHTDNLSKILQNPKLTSSEGQSIAELTCQSLERMKHIMAFFEKVCAMQAKFDVDDPTSTRRRNAPEIYELDTGDGHHPETHKAL